MKRREGWPVEMKTTQPTSNSRYLSTTPLSLLLRSSLLYIYIYILREARGGWHGTRQLSDPSVGLWPLSKSVVSLYCVCSSRVVYAVSCCDFFCFEKIHNSDWLQKCDRVLPEQTSAPIRWAQLGPAGQLFHHRRVPQLT